VFEYELFWKHKIDIKEEMIKDFIILNCIGKNDKIGLKVNNNFFIHHFDQKIKNNEQLVISILNLIKKHKVNFDKTFSILVNNGPGSFSSIRISLAVAKGMKISKNIKIFGFKNSDLPLFSLANIEVLIKKNLLEINLIKPLYSS
jgi:tRNA A37 threonylcarbamoyladenosine modification protein TsaB